MLENGDIDHLNEWIRWSFANNINEDELRILEKKFKSEKLSQTMIDSAYERLPKLNQNEFCNKLAK